MPNMYNTKTSQTVIVHQQGPIFPRQIWPNSAVSSVKLCGILWHYYINQGHYNILHGVRSLPHWYSQVSEAGWA